MTLTPKQLTPEQIIKEHQRKLASKGGSSTSKAKQAAARKSLAKARKTRWKKA